MVKNNFISIVFFIAFGAISCDSSGQRIDTVFSFSNVPIRNGILINYFRNSPKSLINYVDGLIVKNVNKNNDSVFAICDGLVKVLSINSKGYMCFIKTNEKVFIYSLLENVKVKNDSIIKCGDYIGLLGKSVDTMDSELQLTITTRTRDLNYLEQVEIFRNLVSRNCAFPLCGFYLP